MSPSLEIARLGKVRKHGSGKVTARCPACAETGNDRTGNHLAIFPDGRFACAAHAGDEEHRKRIFALAGMHTEPTTERRREWRERQFSELRRQKSVENLVHTTQIHRSDLIRHFSWDPADVWEDSPQRIDGDLVELSPTHFLNSLFAPSDILWTGEVHHSGSASHADRWRSCDDWHEIDSNIGPMTTPAIWKPGTHSRAAVNVLSAPYTVIDFDGLDGVTPDTPDEISRHLLTSLAFIRWLRDGMNWHLAAILYTGGKSLHAWFSTPPPDVLTSLRDIASPLGIDAGLIGRPEHPCRLPGQLHQKSGKLSRVLWLQRPDAIR